MRGVGTVFDVTDVARIPAPDTGGAGGGVELLLGTPCTFTGTDVGDCTEAGEPGEPGDGDTLAAAAVGYGLGAVGVIVVADAGVIVLAAVVLVVAVLVVLAAVDKLEVKGPTSIETTTNKLNTV